MIPSVSEVSKLSSLPINEAIEQPEVQNAIGKKHASKRYDQFTISKMIIILLLQLNIWRNMEYLWDWKKLNVHKKSF